jgi:hypothetical protein
MTLVRHPEHIDSFQPADVDKIMKINKLMAKAIQEDITS